jgi:hypothetical protein
MPTFTEFCLRGLKGAGPIGLLSWILLAVTACFAAETGAHETVPSRDRVEYAPGRELCRLENPEITESSGVALGRANDGVFWTHNDSGDEPRLFAFDIEGRDLGVFTVTGASHGDWEDVASFSDGKRGYIVIADVGDNLARREECRIYVVEEPRVEGPRAESVDAEQPSAAPQERGRAADVVQTIRFTYEDGPRDCESVAVDVEARTVYLVDKVMRLRCKVYALPIPERETEEPSVAKAVATVNVPAATAMDMSPDGRRAVVLTYLDACEYVRAPDETWAEAFARPPRVIRMPFRAQGEGICYGSDGETLYLTSEVAMSGDVACPLLEVPVVKHRDEGTSPEQTRVLTDEGPSKMVRGEQAAEADDGNERSDTR